MAREIRGFAPTWGFATAGLPRSAGWTAARGYHRDRRRRASAGAGFIDVHTHIEGAVEKVPRGDNYLLDGVTTVITGNCGGSEVNLAAWFARSKSSAWA